jgi:AraC family transcriptional regulator of adaptative response/methylated-DNA-[protein]-cysteine methyltransferase
MLTLAAKTLEIPVSLSRASDEERWRAVVLRDESADGHFFVGVKTTGIYCRPSCRSRQPLRKNVEFFRDQEEAKSAGYRPCKRCRPDDVDPRRDLERMLVQACRLLESGDRGARSDEVAAQLGLSRHYFQRFFKRRTGVTPQQYRRRALSERAKSELSKADSVTDAVYAAGYSSSSRFYESAGRELGMSPREARAGARGRTVKYALRPCSLGRLLVAWTERGVCDVQFGDSDAEVAETLAERLPGAVLAEAEVPRWVDDVADLAERPHNRRIPVDIQGTAFQERVWKELQRIPAGETRTYTEIARAIGAPTSARAVARACATNRIALVVPCHRVIRTDGDLSGYRWGRERKASLLRGESKPRRA